MEHDAGKGLQADTQRSPAGMPGGIFEDTLRSAVLHLLLSLFSPCRARRPRRVANGGDRPYVGQYILDGEILDSSGYNGFRQGDRNRPVARLDRT